MMKKATRWSLATAALLIAGYTALVAAMYIFQRELVFAAGRARGLSEPGTLAMEGSQRVAIQTADGQTIAGWYLAPADATKPVFLFFHGKGGGLERKKWRWQRIAKAGAGVLAISYRGYAGSTGEPSEAGLYEDARAAYRWLVARHDSDHIVLHGLSLGTAVAAKLATEVDAKAVILEAAFTALGDVAAERYPWAPITLLLEHPFRTVDIVDKLRMPVVIAHGDHDTVVPYAQAQELYRHAPQPKALWTFAGSDHSTLVRDGLYERLWPYLGIATPTSQAGR